MLATSWLVFFHREVGGTEEQLNIREYVKMSVDAEVPPLALTFTPVTDCLTGRPVGYVSATAIQSILLGHLPEEKYTKVSDRPELAEEMLYHNLQHAASTLGKLQKAERRVGFISVRAPETLVENGDLYRVMARVLSKNPQINPEKILVVFPAAMLNRDTEKVRKALLDVQILKVRTALRGCGKEDFPAVKLIELKPDAVFLDPAITSWAGNRNKPTVFPSFVSYLKSMGMEVYAEAKDEQRMALRSAGCDGILKIGEAPLTEDEVLSRKEDD